ncbi:MAG: hypothetical protein RRA92_09200 [Gemmatimonadota bacterium]|nr:hypothetical protein [Gemmatimonadota bacterium]
MKKSVTGLLAAALLVTGAGQAPAQDLAKICGSIGGVGMGDWAEYTMEGPNAAQVSGVRFALVHRGEVAKPWFELKANTVQGEQVVQLQVPGFPFGPTDVADGIMKAGPMPAMRLPEQMIGMMKQQMMSNPMFDVQVQCLASELVGEETVEVPAGRIKAWHLRVSEGEAWVSPDVPFGIVRGESAEGGDVMVLAGHGSDATSSIPEEPQAMPAMPAGPPPRD